MKNHETDTKTKHHMIESTGSGQKSLDEVNGTVEVPQNAGFWRTLMAYTGPVL